MFKVLVVEDDNDLNRTVCLFLNQREYEAEGCLNVNDAYDKMYETVFDLIVSSRKLEIGSFVMDADEHTAYLGDTEIPMTTREFSILYKLLSYPKKTFTRTQLMDEFWDVDT